VTVALTDEEKRRKLPWAIAASVPSGVFSALAFSAVFVLFLNELGLDKTRIGLISSLWPFCGILSPFVAPYVYRFGVKRTAVLFWTVRKIAVGLIAFTPLIAGRWGLDAGFAWVAAMVVVFGVCRAIAETGVYPWIQEAIPHAVRGKLSAITNVLATVASIAATSLAAYIIGRGAGAGRFAGLIGLAAVMGLLYVWCQSHLAGGAPVPSSPRAESHLRDMRATLQDRNFRLFLVAQPLVGLGSAFAVAFIPLFAKEQVGLPTSMVVLLSLGVQVGSLLSSYLWGANADRLGSKPVMLGSVLCLALLPLTWTLMPRQGDGRSALAMAISCVQGVGTIGWGIGYSRYLFVRVIPPDKRQAYLSVYYPWTEFMSGLGPLLAGSLLDSFRSLGGHAAFLRLDAYTPLFALSLVLLLAALVPIWRLRSDRALLE
jgi:MFS family permease